MASKNQKEIVCVVTESGCHECVSHSVAPSGYPMFERDGKHQKIHRYVYQQKHI